jgi:hypothetical protein
MKISKKVDEHGTIRYRNELGQLHREDGPAVEFKEGTKGWLINGKYHREDGPAVEFKEGTKSWYINGQFHREDGPAIEYAHGDKFWLINGKEHTEQEFNDFLLKKRLQKILEL